MFPVQVLHVNLYIAEDNDESKTKYSIFAGSEHPKPLIFFHNFYHDHFKLCVYSYFHEIFY